jgi:plasmid replication initiation protein
MTEAIAIKPNQFHLVAKSNDLIYKSYRLTVVEQRLVAILASKIHPADHDFSDYYFSYADLASLCGLQRGGNIVRDVKNAIEGLRGKTLRLPCLGVDGKPAEMLVGWLSAAICSDAHSGGATLRLEPELKPYFLALRARFTQYGLHNIVQMTTSYGIRFYEAFKSRQGLGKMTLRAPDARRIAGVSDDEHVRPTDFRRKVVEPAVRDINSKTDIKVKLKRIMKNRQLVGWEATICHQIPKGFDDVAPPPVAIEAPPRPTKLESERLSELRKIYIAGLEMSPNENMDFTFLSSKQDKWDDFLRTEPNQQTLCLL